MGVVVRMHIDFLILFIPTPLVLALFAAASLLLSKWNEPQNNFFHGNSNLLFFHIFSTSSLLVQTLPCHGFFLLILLLSSAYLV